MAYRIGCLMLLAGLSNGLGCSICANPFDHDYVTYGSRTPRLDMKHGRVGSVFSDPAMNGGAPSEMVEVLDEGYSDILEGSDSGPIFMDEPSEMPEIIQDNLDRSSR